jgi:hypothetical protein
MLQEAGKGNEICVTSCPRGELLMLLPHSELHALPSTSAPACLYSFK